MSPSRDVGVPPTVDFADAMSDRYSTPAAPAPKQSTDKPATTGHGGPSATTRRSWLLPREVAEEFAAAADRIHHASGGRVSKSQAQAALMQAGTEREAEITKKLLGDSR